MDDKGTEALSGDGKAKPKADDKKGDKKGDKKPKKKKAGLRHMHIQENHDGSFHVERGQQDANGMPGGMPGQYSAATPDDLHDQIDEHFGGGGGDEQEDPDEDSQPGTSQPPAAAAAQ